MIDRTGARTIILGVAEKLSDLEIQLPPPKRPESIIDGIVVWSDGSPVANAHVTVKDITRRESLFDMKIVDKDGRFRLNGFVGQKLVIEARGVRRNVPNGYRAEAEQVGKVTLTLQRSAEAVRIVLRRLPNHAECLLPLRAPSVAADVQTADVR